MALTNRPIIPKNPKATNKQLVKWYRANNKQCEICLLDGLEVPFDDTHHIIPGAGRTDKIWCIIDACRKHHIDFDHRLNPGEAEKWRCILFAIKYLKNEISDKKLIELGYYEGTMLAIPFIEDKFKLYKEGKS